MSTPLIAAFSGVAGAAATRALGGGPMATIGASVGAGILGYYMFRSIHRWVDPAAFPALPERPAPGGTFQPSASSSSATPAVPVATHTPDAVELSRLYKIGLPLASRLLISAAKIQAHPVDLANLIYHESKFDPRAQYGIPTWQNRPFSPGRATGLLQFTPEVAQEMGLTTHAIFQMSAMQQFDLIDRYLARWAQGRPMTKTRLYMSVLRPASRDASPYTPFPPDAAVRNMGYDAPIDYIRKVDKEGPTATPLA